MYKQFFFLNKSEDKNSFQLFTNDLSKKFSDISGKEIHVAKVESNLLLDQKYSHFFEVEFESKDKLNELMNTAAGKQLTKDITNLHKSITVISVNFDK